MESRHANHRVLLLFFIFSRVVISATEFSVHGKKLPVFPIRITLKPRCAARVESATPRKGGNKMKHICDLVCDMIPVHLRGGSNQEEVLAIGKHIAVCEACADYYCLLFVLILQHGPTNTKWVISQQLCWRTLFDWFLITTNRIFVKDRKYRM